jgi:2-methylisocitrate lyase-like PEP mutase family enzyme
MFPIAFVKRDIYKEQTKNIPSFPSAYKWGLPMTTSVSKSARFSALHQRAGVFHLPNPWDVGSAKMLASLGVEALATTSAGFAFSQGKKSTIGQLTCDEVMAHAKEIVTATDLPVSADLENGYGHKPEDVAKTVERAIEIGLAGCTIEDATGDPKNPIYDRTLAIERIAAGVEAAQRLDKHFMLTARSENYLFNRPDINDTLERLLGYQRVGAQVLYAPGLPDLKSISMICQTVDMPINVVAGIGLQGISVLELQTAGVKRISAGSALSRVAFGAMIAAMNRILQSGSFEDYTNAASFSALDNLISRANT